MNAISPRIVFAAVLVICLALVGGGAVLAELMRIAACPLCILQRMLYLVLAALALVGLTAGGARRPVAGLMALAAATGAGVAAYQVWIQRFAPKTVCGKDYPWWERLVDWAGEQVPLLFQSSGLCSDPGWKFIGLSIAEWSLIVFIVLTGVALHTALRRA